jgi:putative membrane protein
MGRPNIGDHVLAGLVGGLAGCFAMEHFQRLLGRLSPDLGGAPGAGGQQYRRPQSEPSTYLAADKITRAATGRPLRAENKPAGGSIVHYAFGGTVGAAYGLLTAYRPEAASGRGMPFAVAVWLVADEAGMPLAGLARRPSAYPPTDHLTTFATHLLFGATLETVRRVCLWPDHDPPAPARVGIAPTAPVTGGFL